MADAPPFDRSLPEGGTVRPILRWGDPVMHRPQQPVAEFAEPLRGLAADMVATMRAADGVGLAACQIGVDLALFVFWCPNKAGELVAGAVCNPRIAVPEGRDRRLDVDDEGCLSCPGAFVECARPDWARVEGQGLDGAPVAVDGDGLLARCLQHETDHVHGRVFGDRLSKRARKQLAKRAEAAAEEFPEGWPATSA